MPLTLAFDVYGTLINTHGVVVELEKWIGQRAPDFSQAWRDKQLEYSFRRGLMQEYKSFASCTRDALEYCCLAHGVELSASQKQALLDCYGCLPVFPDVKQGLERFQTQGHRLYAFSNGTAEAVNGLLDHAGIRDYFLDIVSVDEIKTFKPDPATYRHFLRRSGSRAAQSWLISSNPFDVIGARSYGLNAAWVQRSSGAVFDPWGAQPSSVVSNLAELAERLG